MGRSLSSRIGQFEASRKRVSHPAADSEQTTLSGHSHYKKPRALKSHSCCIQAAASESRLASVEETVRRNEINQTKQIAIQQLDDDEAKFYREIDSPLSKVCGACGELVPPKSVRDVPYCPTDPRFKLLEVHKNGVRDPGLIPAGTWLDGSTEYVTFCTRCDRSIQHVVEPKFSIASGFKLAAVPKCLTILNPTEARMLGLGVCFTTCFSLGNFGQSATRGNSINFWNDQIDIVSKLPRPPHLCGVIQLKTSSSMGSSTYYPIRPWLLREAITWLRANNPLYCDVTVDERVMASLRQVPDLPFAPVHEDDVDDVDLRELTESDDQDLHFDESFVLEHPTESEREDDLILGALQGEPVGETNVYAMERNDRPKNEYSTDLLMQCCFPTLFPDGRGGLHPVPHEAPRRHTYSLADYCEHLVAWHDRRFIVHPTFKFFCVNLIQRRQVDGLLKKVRPRQEDEAQPIEHHQSDTDASKGVRDYLNDLKPFFRSVRGSGLYWANVRQDIMSMIGSPALEQPWPTFFVTLSAADTLWPDFFRVCDPRLTFEEVANLSSAQKRRYLNEHPNLAARHFHRRFQAFFKYILCGQAKPLGEIVDFFWRIEFQHRGSPHVYALLWVKGAPDVLRLPQTEEGLDQLRMFADRFISCLHRFDASQSSPRADPVCTRPPPATQTAERDRDLEELVHRVQQHICSSKSSCQRNRVCRFDKTVAFPHDHHRFTRTALPVRLGFPLPFTRFRDKLASPLS